MTALAADPALPAPPRPWRLHMLRAGYLLLVVGLGAAIWPELLHHPEPWAPQRGVVVCMLAAMSALAVLGLRYPLQMLPLLFFEMAWKSIWLLAIAAPAWLAHRMDPATAELAGECLIAVVFVVVTPWDHVYRAYVRTFAGSHVRRGRPAATDAVASPHGVIAR
jgi:hypothetical protein